MTMTTTPFDTPTAPDADLTRAEVTVLIDGKELVAFAKNAVTFASKDWARPILCHTLTSVTAGKLRTVSTDSFGLLDQTMEVSGDNATSPAVMVDWSAVASMKLPAGMVKVTVSAAAVVVDAHTQVVSLPVFEGQFPNFEGLKPKPFADRPAVDCFAFTIGQLRSVSQLAKLTAPGARFNKSRGEQFSMLVTPGETALKPFTVEADHDGWVAYMLFMPIRPVSA